MNRDRRANPQAQDGGPEAPASGPDVPAGAVDQAGPTVFLEGIEALTPQTPPELAVIVLNRLAYGPRPGSFDYNTFRNVAGATDADKLVAWVDWQLNPGRSPTPSSTRNWRGILGLSGPGIFAKNEPCLRHPQASC